MASCDSISIQYFMNAIKHLLLHYCIDEPQFHRNRSRVREKERELREALNAVNAHCGRS